MDIETNRISALSCDDLMRAYMLGYFPMSEARDSDDLFWVLPEYRGILPLDGFHIPRSLRKRVRQDHFRVSVNTCFRDVMEACAAPAPGREETWINERILATYTELHELGFAHSVECWSGDDLVGGLYGVHLNGAFFGESMFSRRTDASKVALVHLVGRLRAGDFRLLDTQFHTDHLEQFGVVEVARSSYQILLDDALNGAGDFFAIERIAGTDQIDGSTILQPITQTS